MLSETKNMPFSDYPDRTQKVICIGLNAFDTAPRIYGLNPKAFNVFAKLFYLEFFEDSELVLLTDEELWRIVRRHSHGPGWINQRQWLSVQPILMGIFKDMYNHPKIEEVQKDARFMYPRIGQKTKDSALRYWELAQARDPDYLKDKEAIRNAICYWRQEAGEYVEEWALEDARNFDQAPPFRIEDYIDVHAHRGFQYQTPLPNPKK